ncbi:DJ-1/PfpI family protein [Solirubrobacter sp. CPCC 204708]|uniref:DJ-1/PfpI family protein n=1 Tax=Solirubrobacter deserti TaxID=2282478 RepID=A0ABT4RJK0_9ACTN|nr:DJ-1/PfpI family protein [Solirubrobacter deserti]MBE2319826.1 DJ-1/PfpI family protein [Solirubrobacter deserti]MDA0138693.1 DJ-1/PfpI family protein [Solirubrobacter deserti]
MTRVVMPVYEDVEMLDVSGPYDLFRWTRGKVMVDLRAEVPGPVTFNGGFTFNVDEGLGEATPCAALWVPGGDPAALQRLVADRDGPYLDFLRRQAAVSDYVCSVCEGAILLAAAGLLDSYTVTTHWAFASYLRERHPAVTVADGHPRFVLDRNRLTGGGISSGLDEALKLIELITDRDTAERVQQTTQYYPAPPVHSEIPDARTSPV